MPPPLLVQLGHNVFFETSNNDAYGAFESHFGPSPQSGGPLSGVRLCVKDNISVAGGAFTAGQPLFRHRVGETTAPAVATLQNAGAQVVGMVKTDSGGLGMTTPGVRNPVQPGRTVGGSSGGCAAAIAGGLADLGLGTDTGGSIRVPAACTDLYGFKPTHGSMSVDGVWPLSPSMDHLGLMARSLDVIEVSMNLLLPTRIRPSQAAPGRTLLVESTLPQFTSGEVQRRFQAIVSRLQDAGFVIKFVDAPAREDVVGVFAPIVLAEAAQVYGHLPVNDKKLLSETTIRSLAAEVTPRSLSIARDRIAELRYFYDQLFASGGVLISPTMLIDLPSQDAHTLTIDGSRKAIIPLLLAGTCFCNIAGIPALSMPVKLGEATSNIHLAAASDHDFDLVAHARSIEFALGGC